MQELYLVASQVDSQLFGSEKKNAEGRLPDVLQNIRSNLAQHARSIIAAWDVVGSEEIKARMLELGQERLFCTAAIGYGLSQNLEAQGVWDENERYVWGRLCQAYPEYFSDGDVLGTKANLELLTGTAAIHRAFADVRERKDAITEEKRRTYGQTEERKIQAFSADLQKSIEQRIGEVQRTDVDKLREQQQLMQKNISRAKDDIDEEYRSLVEEFCTELRQGIHARHSQLFRQVGEGAESAKGTKTETYQQYVGRGGFLWLKKKYETRTRQIFTVNAGTIYRELSSLTGDIQNQFETEISERVKTWRKQVANNLVRTLRDNLGDEDLNIGMIQRTLREVFQSVEIPTIEFGELPGPLRQTGTLRDSQAESYMNEVYRFLPDFQQQVRQDVVGYLQTLEETLVRLDCAEKFMANFNAQAEQLAREIENREMTIESYQRSLSELQTI